MFSGCPSFVAVVQPTDLTHCYDWSDFGSLNRTRLRRAFSQGHVRSGSMVIVEIGSEGSAQRAFIQHDDMVEAFASNGADFDTLIWPHSIL